MSRGRVEVSLLILNLSTRIGWVLNTSLQLVLPLGETPVTHCTGVWVGTRVGLDRYGEGKNL